MREHLVSLSTQTNHMARYPERDRFTHGLLENISSHALLEALPESVVIADLSGTVHYLNPGAVRLLGTSAAKARGRPITELLTLLDCATLQPIPEPLAVLFATASSEPCSLDLLLERPDGSRIPVDYTIGPILGQGRNASAGVILLMRDSSRTQTRIAQLVEAVRHDEHTQLLRRGELERRLARVLQGMQDGDQHALLFMDLDRFKSINDSAGHMAGDRVLREVAELFRTQVRDRDTLARLGGDEFGLLLEHCPLELARERAGTLQAAVSSHRFYTGSRIFTLGISIGIAAVRTRQHAVSAVLAAADSACYAAKRQTGDGVHIRETILD